MEERRELTMKKSTRILLIVVLCLLLIGCTARKGLIAGYTYENAHRYHAGGGAITQQVTVLDVSWIEGKVNIDYHNGDDIRISETASRSLKDDWQVHWLVDGNTLYVKYAASGFSTTANLEKQLTLLLPEGLQLKDANISVVSADMDVRALQADTIKLNTVSGKVFAGINTADKLTIDSVSGDLQVDAYRLRQVDLSTVSGDASLQLAHAPEKIKSDAVSGDVTVYLPEGTGFTAELDSVSGKVGGDMPMVSEGKNRYTAGNGECRIDVESVSGDVKVNELNR